MSDLKQEGFEGQIDLPEKETLLFRIVIEYDLQGKFSLHCNVQDEVLTTGMLKTAKERLKENYQLQRIKQIQEQREKEILRVQ